MVIVEALEIVDIEQRDTELRIGAVGARRFAFVTEIEAAAIEHAGEVIDVHETAQLPQFDLQCFDFALGALQAFL